MGPRSPTATAAPCRFAVATRMLHVRADQKSLRAIEVEDEASNSAEPPKKPPTPSANRRESANARPSGEENREGNIDIRKTFRFKCMGSGASPEKVNDE
jgi:hypothetical protein